MKKTIGCLHAHYSNIDYIQSALGSDQVELVHFVDPGLMRIISADKQNASSDASAKVIDQINWMAQTNLDAIIITCTNYIALLDEKLLNCSIPIIKIDEPFFENLCHSNEPQTILFTNPATVEGTMNRLHHFATLHGKKMANFETDIIPDAFELIMQGNKELHDLTVTTYIKTMLSSDKNKNIYVAQLSMVEAATKVEDELNIKIGNPLKSLVTHFDNLIS